MISHSAIKEHQRDEMLQWFKTWTHHNIQLYQHHFIHRHSLSVNRNWNETYNEKQTFKIYGRNTINRISCLV